MSNFKKCKLQRKIEKRIHKSHEQLFNHQGLHPSTTPTNNLYVANGGLSNGVTREEIFERFLEFGGVSDIIMHPHKSYCFVVFNEQASSMQACQQLFGQLSLHSKTEDKEKLLYLSYVAQTPEKVAEEKGRLPNGLVMLRDYIGEEETEALLLDLHQHSTPGHQMKHRRVRHYGYQFDYNTNGVYVQNAGIESIPSVCLRILTRLLNDRLIPILPDQLTVNTYLPGQGIPAHIDNTEAFEEHITVISLESQINMDFKDTEGDSISVEVPSASVMVMAGESRYAWSHGIVSRSVDLVAREGGDLSLMKRGQRTSFTFRKIKKEWLEDKKELKNDNSSHALVGKFSTLLEREHVQKVYNVIGDHFSNTRHSPWPQVTTFISSLPQSALVLDVGCGNGKYLKLRRGEIVMMGCDNSTNLCGICSEQGFESLVCDITNLPYRSQQFDAAICIAVIHHLASKERRLAAFKELSRVVVKGGRVLVYVWAMEQRYQQKNSKYLKDSDVKSSNIGEDIKSIDFNSIEINSQLVMPVHVNRTPFKQQDTLVPWHLSGDFKQSPEQEVLHRYYHLFTKGEVDELCKDLSEIELKQEYYDQGNWAYEFVRP